MPKVTVNLVVLNILIALIIDTSAVVREEIEESEASTCFNCIMFCCMQSLVRPSWNPLSLERHANCEDELFCEELEVETEAEGRGDILTEGAALGLHSTPVARTGGLATTAASE